MTQIDARSTREDSRGRRQLTPAASLELPGQFAPSLGNLDRSPLAASIASTVAERRAAAVLVASRYAWRGYVVDAAAAARSPGVTLIATAASRTLGTLTVRGDGPGGLAADECYREALDAVRLQGRTACELTQFAMDAAADWRATLGALVGLAYEVSRNFYKATDVFVEVNPRHERFYRRAFGFVAAGARRICPRVEAPAVLLRLELERNAQQVLSAFAAPLPAGAVGAAWS